MASNKKRKPVPGAAEKNPNYEATTNSKEPASEEGGRDFVGPLSGSGTLVRIDTDVLDCPICFEALHPPIHQCRNGHVACSACCVNLTFKCPSCSQIMGLFRCLALEKVVESVEISCPNAINGCDATVSYLNRTDHQKSCIYTPCSCPFSSCSFRGPIASLTQHFTDNHEKSEMKFSYKSRFCVIVRDDKAFLIFIYPDNRLFLLISSDITGGKLLSVICICPATKDHKFLYELSVSDYETELKLKSSAEMACEWEGVHPKVSLFVPYDLFSDKKIFVYGSIRKVNSGGNHV